MAQTRSCSPSKPIASFPSGRPMEAKSAMMPIVIMMAGKSYGILPNTLTYHINPGRDTDWNLDWTTIDIQPPVTGMNALYPTQPYQFTVSWWGQDAWSGMSSYSVQVR